MRDIAMEQYFVDVATSSLIDAENYRNQGRIARSQESLQTSRYFAAKVKPASLPENYEERVRKLSTY